MSELELDEVTSFLDREGVAAVYLFGSFAEGRSHEDSDVDIGLLVETESELNVSELERELTGRLGRKVDLRVLNGKNTRFLYNGLRESELMLSRDEEARKEFEYRVMRNCLDLKPFYQEYDSYVRERLTG